MKIIEEICNKYNIDYKFIKFLFVGGINTLFGYFAYSVLLMVGLSYPLALFLGTILAVLFNFKTTGTLVFKNSNNKLIVKFVGTYCLLYLVNLLFLRIFDLFKINMYLAGFILLLPMAGISYLLMRKFVFKEKKNQLPSKDCIICKNSDTKSFSAKLADFIADRVFDNEQKELSLIHCQNCGFAYFDYRFSDDECKKLYTGYRDENYQKQREKHECWYSKEINDLIGKNEIELNNRQKNLSELLMNNIDAAKIDAILDFGGDKGQFIPEMFSDSKKYVYDISGIETVERVISIKSFDDCLKNSYDLILCAHVLEHVSDPLKVIEEIKSLMKKGQYLYVELPFDSPFYKNNLSNLKFLFNKYFSWKNIFKHYINTGKNAKTHQMHEHINHFTPKSIELLLNQKGFKIIHNGVKEIDCDWMKAKIISTLCILQ